uniref:Uncharacterized protein n=1 Tax=Arundo donax TaxID=35708 RepID=A0A0A9DNX2_ARUDO
MSLNISVQIQNWEHQIRQWKHEPTCYGLSGPDHFGDEYVVSFCSFPHCSCSYSLLGYREGLLSVWASSSGSAFCSSHRDTAFQQLMAQTFAQ